MSVLTMLLTVYVLYVITYARPRETNLEEQQKHDGKVLN